MKLTLLVFGLVLLPTIVWADCLDLTDKDAKILAKRIYDKINNVRVDNNQVPPVISIKFVDKLDPTDTSVLSDDEYLAKENLTANGCLNRNQIIHSIRSAASADSIPLVFVSPETESLAQVELDRISKIGYRNLDKESYAALRAKFINFVAVIGGGITADARGCTFDFNFRTDIDIHSLQTREIISFSEKLGLSPSPPPANSYMKLGLNGNHRYLQLVSKSNTPICLGKVQVTADINQYGDYIFYSKWHEDVGCILPGEEWETRRSLSHWRQYDRLTWGEMISFKPGDSCGEFSVFDFPSTTEFRKPRVR